MRFVAWTCTNWSKWLARTLLHMQSMRKDRLDDDHSSMLDVLDSIQVKTEICISWCGGSNAVATAVLAGEGVASLWRWRSCSPARMEPLPNIILRIDLPTTFMSISCSTFVLVR